MKVALLFLIVSTNAWSMSCNGIPEGKVVRLDSPGGNLEKAAIQDQDGVGSCFANQASLMLQSVIKDNPNLSYLNLGLFYTNDASLPDKRKVGDKKFTRDTKDLEGADLLESNSSIDGGFACKTIEMALERQKKSGKGVVCKATDLNLEHSVFKDNQSPEKTLASASRYMNKFQEKFGYSFEKSEQSQKKLLEQREKADAFTMALKTFVKNNYDDYLEKKCSVPDTAKTLKIINRTIARAALANKNCYNDKGKMITETPECLSFEQLGSTAGLPDAKEGAPMVIFDVSRSVATHLKSNIMSVYKPEDGFGGYLKSITNLITENDKSKHATAQKEKLNQVLVEAISPEDKSALESEFKKIVLHQNEDCKADNVLAFFIDKNEFINKAKNDSTLAQHCELIERASDLASVLPEKTFGNLTSFLDFLTKSAGINYDEGMMNLIANDCTPDKRVMIPEKLKCDSVTMGFKKTDFPDDRISADAQKVILENRVKMLASIQAKQAVGLSICTKFWGDPNYDYNKDEEATKDANCQSTGIHGFHAITMIGYRCVDNKVQYLAQNSWGPNWKLEKTSFEIENGKIWLDEDKLYKNLSAINYLSQ